ncbi:MAG: hypothetical protein GXY23_09615 [Myxococcales bacterium]|nr:hypothetical protein [Myxococcales bacterium]
MRLPALLAVVLLSSLASTASAQYSDEYDRYSPTREWLSLSLGVGTYRPNVGSDVFRDVFGKDKGPLLTGGIDFRLFRLGDFAAFTVGAYQSWARYEARACAFDEGVVDCDNRASERTMLRIFPLSVLAGLNIDVLARKFRVPFYFVGRIGLDSVFYGTRTGGERDAAGTSIGLRWEAEVDLELDFLERRAQRTLDDEWGINHTYLLFKIYGSTAQSMLPVGTKIAWVAGLGFVF